MLFWFHLRRAEMAGKLKPDEMRDVISRLNAISNSLESAVATLLQSQEDLKKANETQTYLNQSLQALYAAFVPQEELVSPSGDGPA